MDSLGNIGEASDGILRRVAYSRGDIQARKYIQNLMVSLGLSVRLDAAGNLIGTRKGKNPNLAPIAMGSHTDAVPDGGKYDGDVGVIGALAAIQLLNENHILTNHPIEVIDFVDEEGGLTGSQAMIGALKPSLLNQITSSKKTIGQGINDLGGNPENLDQAIRKKGDLSAFLELHINQGANLENAGVKIGIVEGIVGISAWKISIQGMVNHAGTTPMKGRRDALVVASKLILLINQTAINIPGRQVATVGRISAFPGAINVIPGKVVMSLDLRDLSQTKIDSVLGIIRFGADSLAKATETTIQFEPDHNTVPAITDPEIQNIIGLSAREFSLSTLKLPSGAGHDTQEMTHIAPSAMIFVPSKSGISHSPEEYTSPEDITNGVSVLLRTVLKLDKINKSL
jgi:N-carbamoyl-L-amino-acid hydrolase